MLDKLKQELYQALNKYFPSAKIESTERRGIILEIKAFIEERTFIEIYANVVTGKRSFALISDERRITGYDNYKFWHYHPPDAPSKHLPCKEMPADLIISKFKEVLDSR
jgi:hypothetical protein